MNNDNNTQNFNNEELIEGIENTEDTGADFSLLSIFNVATGLFAMLFLVCGENLLHFTVKDGYFNDLLHDMVFSNFAGKAGLCVSNITLLLFILAFITICISFYFSAKKERKVAHLFLILATGINVTAGLYYPLVHIFWIQCKFKESLISAIVYGVLLILGIFGLIRAVAYKETEKAKIKKWIPLLITGILTTITCIALFTPFSIFKEDYQAVYSLRQLIANQNTDYNEEIGYQIGNYINGTALYTDDGLYVWDINSDSNKYEFWNVDAQGNAELIWSSPTDIKEVCRWFDYRDGYLYVMVSNDVNELLYHQDRSWDKILRICVADGTTETFFDPERKVHRFGFNGNLLMVALYDNEIDKFRVYTYDLSMPVTEENGVLYDDWLDHSFRGTSAFYNHYLYNNPSYYHYILTNQCTEDAIYSGYNDMTRKTTDGEKYDIVDSEIIAFNIFDNQIFYITYSEDRKYYEFWSCDLLGENKALIGTISTDTYGDCFWMNVTDTYIIFDLEEETGAVGKYLMWLDDGSYEKLW